jgi:DNA polymerase-1
MRADTSSQETRSRYVNSHLWKPWMNRVRLRQIISLEELEEYLEQHQHIPRISWDVETDSLFPHKDRVCGHCLAFNSNEGIYIPTAHVNYPAQNLDSEQVWKLVLGALEDRTLVVYNWKYEGYILRSMGINRSPTLKYLNDAMVYRWLYDSDKKQFNLKDAATELLGIEMLKIDEVPGVKTGKRKRELNFALSDPSDATLYAAADPVFTLAVLDHCKPVVDSQQPFIVQMEHELYGPIFSMETNPITVDRGHLRQARKDLSHWITLVARNAYQKAGREFNIDSPHEVAQILKEMGVPLTLTEKGNLETNAKAIEKLAGQFPIVDDVLYYRTLVKERSTYVDALLEATSEENPSCVFKFTSVGAPTGRLSSGGVQEDDPLYAPMNVQAIPSASAYRMALCHRISNPPPELLALPI